MRVYVDGVERVLTVVDRETGKNFATMVVCSQERLDKDDFGNFTMTEDEFHGWESVLATFQQAEDLTFSIKDRVNAQELDDYIYEETKYLTSVKETAETEVIILKLLCKALENKNEAWLLENGFVKTSKKVMES